MTNRAHFMKYILPYYLSHLPIIYPALAQLIFRTPA